MYLIFYCNFPLVFTVLCFTGTVIIISTFVLRYVFVTEKKFFSLSLLMLLLIDLTCVHLMEIDLHAWLEFLYSHLIRICISTVCIYLHLPAFSRKL